MIEITNLFITLLRIIIAYMNIISKLMMLRKQSIAKYISK